MGRQNQGELLVAAEYKRMNETSMGYEYLEANY
jgi:hypothetical protein